MCRHKKRGKSQRKGGKNWGGIVELFLFMDNSTTHTQVLEGGRKSRMKRKREEKALCVCLVGGKM